MHAAWLVTRKDLRQRVRDRSAILLGVVIPLALAAVFDLTFGGVADGDFQPRYVVAIEDDGPAAAGLRDALTGIAAEGAIDLTTAPDRAAAVASVVDGDRDAAIVVPAGFSAGIATGGGDVEVIGSPDAPLATDVAAAIARGFTDAIVARRLAVATTLAVGGDPREVEAIVAAAGRPGLLVLTTGEVADEQLDQTTYLAAGMAVFFVFFTVQFGVSSLLLEREQGTLRRMAAAPIPPWSVVAGKGLTSILLGVASLTTLVLATTALLGAQWGAPLGVAALIAAVVLASTAIMAVTAALARTPAQANVLQSVTAVLLGALGGVFFDVTLGNEWLEGLSLITPHQWFLRGLGAVHADGASGAMPAVGALLLFTAIGVSAAWLVARRRAVT